MTLQGATRLLRWPAHVEAFPLHRPSWHNYVVDLVGAGRDDEAERVARRALQLYPDVLDEGEGLRPLRERLKRREPARATLSANEIERRVGRVVDARYTLLGVQAQSEGQVLFHGLRLEDGVQVTLRWLRDVPPSAARRLFDAQRSAEQLPAACARPIDVVKDEDGEWLQVFRRLVGAEPLSALVAAGR
ncbi:MAG TPA: hypothetical protein VG389_00525, partial [Myxococcota bacterium]|nr:hypothetical protein [Myxococcota bacterium]